LGQIANSDFHHRLHVEQDMSGNPAANIDVIEG
jgi:hypothetical protein